MNNEDNPKKQLKRTPSEERIYQECKDRKSRKGLKQLKEGSPRKTRTGKKNGSNEGENLLLKVGQLCEDQASNSNEKEYDRNDSSTWSSTGGETCSCIYGNPCVDEYICNEEK